MSDVIIEQACAALCEILRAAAPELKAAAPTAEVPDVPAVYPSLAILVDSSKDETWTEIEVEDENGDAIVLDGSLAVMEVGQSSLDVRIFLAARTPRERSRIGRQLRRAFYDDDVAGGRLTVTIPNIEADDRPTGKAWPISFFLEGGEWVDEMAFSEKRWTYLRASVDVPILILRGDATPVTSMRVELSASPTTTPVALTDPSQVAALDPLDIATINADGSVGPTP